MVINILKNLYLSETKSGHLIRIVPTTKAKPMFRLLIMLTALLSMGNFTPASNFKTAQLAYERVKTAYQEKETATRKLFSDKNLKINASQIFIRVFKQEKHLELWARAKGANSTFQLLKTYPICSASGNLGPKRKLGDYQVPEGFYTISRWNPQSNFYLSLGINYPNASDKILSDQKQPGNDIFIHGNCVSIGCLAMTDPLIKEIYVAFVEARNAGQTQVAVHIFPSRLAGPAWDHLRAGYREDESMINFWKNLKTGYEWFETRKTLPRVSVNAQGKYLFK